MVDFCDRALWLRGGHVEAIGRANQVVREYLGAEGGKAVAESTPGAVADGALAR